MIEASLGRIPASSTTTLAEDGADMHDIQQVLGHASVSATEKHYASYASQPGNHAKRSKQSNRFFSWIGFCAISVILHFPSTTVLLNEALDRVSVEKQSHTDLKSPFYLIFRITQLGSNNGR